MFLRAARLVFSKAAANVDKKTAGKTLTYSSNSRYDSGRKWTGGGSIEPQRAARYKYGRGEDRSGERGPFSQIVNLVGDSYPVEDG